MSTGPTGKEKKMYSFYHEHRVVVSFHLLSFKGKWQQKILSAYLKETPKQYIEVYYRILIPALFGEIF